MTERMSSPTKEIRDWANSISSEWLEKISTFSNEDKNAEWNRIVEQVRQSATYEDLNKIFGMAEGQGNAEISLNYNNTIRLRFFAMDINNEKMSYASNNYTSDYLEVNKARIVVWKSWMKKVGELLRETAPTIGYAVDDFYINIGVGSLDDIYNLLAVLGNAKASLEQLRETLVEVTHLITVRRTSEKVDAKRAKGDNGLSHKINGNRNREINEEIVEEQIQKWQGEIQNMLVARTWGWEIEAPNPGDTTVPAGVERGSDGSVESFDTDYDDCECGCSECTYHECDCDDCENRNDDPQHCRYDDCHSASSYEFRTTGGIPRALHPGMRKLLEQIKDTEKNETAGTHIHVYARDLEAYQVGVVLGAYALTQRVWDVIAGRNVETDRRCKQYADLVPGEAVSYTLRHKALYSVGKFNAVNTLHVTTDRGTLEFRQMNCNFDFNRITFYAWMVRGLVEVAKRGATITEFFNITDIEGFIKLYAKYGFTTFKEIDEVEDPVGSRYNQTRNRIVVA